MKKTWRAWLGLPIEDATPEQLEPVYQRRFQGTDRERFRRLWCELAWYLDVSPHELDEHRRLDEPGSRSARFPGTISELDMVCNLVVEETSGIPSQSAFDTVGDLLDWMLSSPPPSPPRPLLERLRARRRRW